jgi:hypothetical protein
MASSVTLLILFMNVPEVSFSFDVSHLVFISYQICWKKHMCCQLRSLLNTSCPDQTHWIYCYNGIMCYFVLESGFVTEVYMQLFSVLVTSYKTWKIVS